MQIDSAVLKVLSVYGRMGGILLPDIAQVLATLATSCF